MLPYFRRAEHNERGADRYHGTGGPINVMDLASANAWDAHFVAAAVQAGFAPNQDFNGAEQEGQKYPGTPIFQLKMLCW